MASEFTVDDTVTVLVVDDEPLLADLLAEWVHEKWHCEVAYGGEGALETFDGDVDLVLTDRQMPDVDGVTLLEVLREEGHTIPVCMVSSQEPSLEVADLPLNDYLVKPVDRPTVQGTVEELLLRRTYHPDIQEFFVCAAKLDAIDEYVPARKRAEDERYLRLRRRADELRQAADATLGLMTDHVERFSVAELDD